MLPPSLKLRRTSDTRYLMLDVVAVPATAKQPTNFWGIDRNVEL
jgi:hypothetical protein